MEICEPVVLTRLPRPAQAGGSVRFGSVWALYGQTKKRRHEICTAIDGDSLNIYEAQTGRSILSHAIPPTTTFATGPTSIRLKQDRQILRQTYFAIHDDGLHLRSVLTRDPSNQEGHITKSIELENSESLIVHIDIVPAREATCVVTVQEDGTLTVASADLQHISSTRITSSDSAQNIQLLAALVLTTNDARKTTLKARDGVVRDVTNDRAILVAAFQTQAESHQQGADNILRYAAWSLSLQSSMPEIQQLFDHKLPVGGLDSMKRLAKVVPSFGPRASTLVLKSIHGVLRFDLTGLVPRKLSEVQTDLLGHQDIISVSNGMTLVAFQDAFRLFDSEYGVVRASLDLNGTLLKRKRKRSGSDSPGFAIDFVSYFAQLGQVLVYSRNHLIACDLRLSGSGTKGSATTLLAHQIGKGVPQSRHLHRSLTLDIGRSLPPEPTKEVWSTVRDSLDKMRQARNAAGFETRLLNYLRLGPRAEGENVEAPETLGTGLSDSQEDYVLSTLFSLASEDLREGQKAELRLNLPAARVIRRLSRAGVLSRWRLQRALDVNQKSTGTSICPGDIAQSLLKADQSCDILSTYVESSGNVDASEQAAIVKLLLVQVFGQSEDAAQRLVTNGTDLASKDTEILEPEASSTALSSNGTGSFMDMLIDALAKLGLQDIKTISSVLRTSFTGGEVLGLTQLLRQQMFKSGYPGSVLHLDTDGAAATTNEGAEKKRKTSAPVLTNDAILKILSACIDAVGPLDLLRREESDDFLENTIPDLLSEISLATQAAEESAGVHGALRETLRYGQSDKVKGRLAKKQLEAAITSQQAGEIVTLYTERIEDEDASSHASTLPLSLHAEDIISKVKVRKGGGQISKRSLRNTLMLENRQKGVYSFDRLVL